MTKQQLLDGLVLFALGEEGQYYTANDNGGFNIGRGMLEITNEDDGPWNTLYIRNLNPQDDSSYLYGCVDLRGYLDVDLPVRLGPNQPVKLVKYYANSPLTPDIVLEFILFEVYNYTNGQLQQLQISQYDHEINEGIVINSQSDTFAKVSIENNAISLYSWSQDLVLFRVVNTDDQVLFEPEGAYILPTLPANSIVPQVTFINVPPIISQDILDGDIAVKISGEGHAARWYGAKQRDTSGNLEFGLLQSYYIEPYSGALNSIAIHRNTGTPSAITMEGLVDTRSKAIPALPTSNNPDEIIVTFNSPLPKELLFNPGSESPFLHLSVEDNTAEGITVQCFLDYVDGEYLVWSNETRWGYYKVSGIPEDGGTTSSIRLTRTMGTDIADVLLIYFEGE